MYLIFFKKKRVVIYKKRHIPHLSTVKTACNMFIRKNEKFSKIFFKKFHSSHRSASSITRQARFL